MTTMTLEEMVEHPQQTVARAQQAPLMLEDQGAPVAVMLSVAEYETIVGERRAALDRYIAAFEAEIEKGFEGPFEDLTPELWEKIRRVDSADVETGSLAVLPGWRPKSSP